MKLRALGVGDELRPLFVRERLSIDQLNEPNQLGADQLGAGQGVITTHVSCLRTQRNFEAVF